MSMADTDNCSYEKALGFHRFWSVDDKQICTYVIPNASFHSGIMLLT